MITKTSQFVVLTATLVVGLFALAIPPTIYAESVTPFRGIYEGGDSDGTDDDGSFNDLGIYSAFDGVVESQGTYHFDNTLDTFTTQYTISDEDGNSLSFETIETDFIEYGKGKFGIAQSEWTIVGGEGKFSGATGSGDERTWYNLEDMSYKGITSGDIFLS
jgi:hypothetical protein